MVMWSPVFDGWVENGGDDDFFFVFHFLLDSDYQQTEKG